MLDMRCGIFFKVIWNPSFISNL